MHSEETKAKIRAAWVERRKTFVPPMKGKKHTAATRQKMSDAAKRRPSNARGGNLRAHHVVPFAEDAQLRLVVSNGLTLCNPCHLTVHRELAEERSA